MVKQHTFEQVKGKKMRASALKLQEDAIRMKDVTTMEKTYGFFNKQGLLMVKYPSDTKAQRGCDFCFQSSPRKIIHLSDCSQTKAMPPRQERVVGDSSFIHGVRRRWTGKRSSLVCYNISCTLRPSSGFPGDNRPSYCSSHRLPGMENIVNLRCEEAGCKIRAFFGDVGDARPTLCGLHRTENMENLVSPRCAHEGCKVIPVFGYDDAERPSFCSTHRKPGMFDIKSRRCIHDDCKRLPLYSFQQNDRPLHCGKHKLPGMFDVMCRRCEHEGCNKRPSFGEISDKVRRFCKQHCPPEMSNVRKVRLCAHKGCEVQPVFGFDAKTMCSKHKVPGMKDLQSPRCQNEECDTQASFARDGDRPTYCVKHKSSDMVDVQSRRCSAQDCIRQPLYALPGATEAFHCGLHKLPDMVNITGRRCDREGCNIHPVFGFPHDNKSPRFCAQHKEEGMEDIVSVRCTWRSLSGTTCPSASITSSKFCTIHTPGYQKPVTGYSKVACRFFDAYAAKTGVKVQHAHYDPLTLTLIGAEKRVRYDGGKQTKVDGFIASTTTILEFHGDFWHGNPKKYARDDMNQTAHKTYGELYDATMRRMKLLKKSGYKVEYIWEADFVAWEKAGLMNKLPINTI